MGERTRGPGNEKYGLYPGAGRYGFGALYDVDVRVVVPFEVFLSLVLG